MKQYDRLVVIQSLLVAFFADIRCINWGLTKGGFVAEGIMPLLYTLIAFFILLCVIYNRKIPYSLNYYSIFLPIYLLLYYFITDIFIQTPVVPIYSFLIFTIVSFFIPHITRVNAKLMIKLMIALPAFSILRLQTIFASVVDWTTRLPMDVSYGYLVPIIANVVYLWLYFKNESKLSKVFTIIFTTINFIFLLNILLYGSRGPILCIFLLICFLWCTHKKNNNTININFKRLFFLSISGLCFIVFFNSLLMFTVSFLSSYGIEVDAISKMIYLLEQDGDVSNGRSDLNIITWNGIMENPIFGNGLDQFDNKNPGESYPHNFFLQILYDGGLLLLIIFLPIFIKIPQYLKNISHNEFALFATFCFASVPGALFSQDLWAIPILWMFFGLICSKRSIIE